MVTNRLSTDKIILWAFGASGAAALIYEIIWTRALTFIFGGSTYALSTVLAAFLAGLALGSYISARSADRINDPILALGMLELFIGILGPATLTLIRHLSPLYASLYYSLHFSFRTFSVAQFALAFLAVLPAATLMGATFPLALRIRGAAADRTAVAGGDVYAANTVGAIAGSALAGLVLLTLIGSGGAAILAGLLNLAVGALLLTLCVRGLRWFTVAGVLMMAVSASASVVYLTGRPLPFNYNMAERYKSYADFMAGRQADERLFDRENAQGRIQVLRNRGNTFLVNNGKIEGSTGGDWANQLLLAYLPLATHRQATTFLNIGLGTGTTLWAAASDSRLKKIYSVEINPAVNAAVQGYFYPRLFEDSRIVSVPADARNFLLLRRQKYDIVSSEPSYPTDTAVAHLFTEDFFRLVKSRLRRNGVFAQWVPYYLFSDDELAALVKTFGRIFPSSSAWNIKDVDMILVGVKGRPINPSLVKQRADELLGDKDLAAQYRLVAGAEIIAQLARDRSLPVNTDDNSLVEFTAARNRSLGAVTVGGRYELRRGGVK